MQWHSTGLVFKVTGGRIPTEKAKHMQSFQILKLDSVACSVVCALHCSYFFVFPAQSTRVPLLPAKLVEQPLHPVNWLCYCKPIQCHDFLLCCGSWQSSSYAVHQKPTCMTTSLKQATKCHWLKETKTLKSYTSVIVQLNFFFKLLFDETVNGTCSQDLEKWFYLWSPNTLHIIKPGKLSSYILTAHAFLGLADSKSTRYQFP